MVSVMTRGQTTLSLVYVLLRFTISPRHIQPYCHIIATILRLQALTLTTAARYRRASHSVKIVAPTLFFRVPFLFTATMSSSADLSASLQVKKLSPTATLPTRGSSLSAGFDLSANEKKVCITFIIYL